MKAHTVLHCVALEAVILSSVHAYPRFVSRLPNADGIPGVQAIGHQNTAGGGSLNVFGAAFEAQDTQWTPSLCQADSDGDGATNGEELGDPCCRWSAGRAQQTATTAQVSHPGVPNTWTPQQLRAMKCQEAFDPEATSGNAALVDATPALPAVTVQPSPETPPLNTASSSSVDAELPSTIDPAGLRETPPSLVPNTPAASSSKPMAPRSTPTPSPAAESSGSERNVISALGVSAVIAVVVSGGVVV